MIGIGDDRFGPEDTVTVAQAITMAAWIRSQGILVSELCGLCRCGGNVEGIDLCGL